MRLSIETSGEMDIDFSFIFSFFAWVLLDSASPPIRAEYSRSSVWIPFLFSFKQKYISKVFSLSIRFRRILNTIFLNFEKKVNQFLKNGNAGRR